MQSNFIAPESVFLLSVEDIISLNLLFFDGTKSLTGQKNLCSINREYEKISVNKILL